MGITICDVVCASKNSDIDDPNTVSATTRIRHTSQGLVFYLAKRAVIPDIAPVDEQHSQIRSEEHTSELQSLMRISYAVFCLKKKKTIYQLHHREHNTKHRQLDNTHTLEYRPMYNMRT